MNRKLINFIGKLKEFATSLQNWIQNHGGIPKDYEGPAIYPDEYLPPQAQPIQPAPQPIQTNPWAIPKTSEKYADYPVELKAKLIARGREICASEGLDPALTQELIETVQGESGWNPYCVNETTKDYGVAQFSARYYLVEYKMTPQYATEHPEECLTIMAQNFKNGRKSNWVADSSGGYKQWIGKTDQELANYKPSWYSY